MKLDKLLNTPIIRTIVNAAAAIKAVTFFLTFLVAGGALLAYVVAKQEKNDSTLIGLSAAYLGLVVVLSICIWYYVKHICDPEPYEISKLEGTLVVEAIEDHHHYLNTRLQTVKALRGNVRLIEVKSHWTGSYSRDTYSVESVNRAHHLFDAVIREEDARVHRWIYLGRALGKKDDPVTVGVHQEWQDDLEPMRPYYREGGARYKTRNLKVTARFAANDAPDESDVEGAIWNTAKAGVTGHISFDRHYDRASQCIEYVVFIEKPKRFHSYGIRWTWPDKAHQSLGK